MLGLFSRISLVRKLSFPLVAVSLLLFGVGIGYGAGLHGNSQQTKPGQPLDPTCTSSAPCIEYNNTSTGAGVNGTSAKGKGIIGVTSFSSTSGANQTFGVFGNDESTSGTFNSGVRGNSTRGSGVSGVSNSGTGVSGVSTSGYAVSGRSTSGGGASFTSNGGVAVDATSMTQVGVFGQSSSDYGVIGSSITGSGVLGMTNGTSAAMAGIEGDNGNNRSQMSSGIAVFANGFGGPLFVGNNSSGTNVFSVDNSGNIVISGTITTSGVCSSGCTPQGSPGTKILSYAPRESEPTMEDLGEAQLVGGQAYVRLDPVFASSIDQHRPYMVFITPEGDSHGLYVASKTLAGFEVRENQGVRSTIPFSYRIVARPFGASEQRLARVAFYARTKHVRLLR